MLTNIALLYSWSNIDKCLFTCHSRGASCLSCGFIPQDSVKFYKWHFNILLVFRIFQKFRLRRIELQMCWRYLYVLNCLDCLVFHSKFLFMITNQGRTNEEHFIFWNFPDEIQNNFTTFDFRWPLPVLESPLAIVLPPPFVIWRVVSSPPSSSSFTGILQSVNYFPHKL